MWTPRLSSQSLLTEANDLGFIVDSVFYDVRGISTLFSVAAEESWSFVLTILRKKVLASHFFNCRIEVCSISLLFLTELVTSLRILLRLVFIKVLDTLIQTHTPNFWQLDATFCWLYLSGKLGVIYDFFFGLIMMYKLLAWKLGVLFHWHIVNTLIPRRCQKSSHGRHLFIRNNHLMWWLFAPNGWNRSSNL